MLDLSTLLRTLDKVSGGRIIAHTFDEVIEDTFHRVSIPVGAKNVTDKTEQTLRKYAKDWIREQGSYSVDAKYESKQWQSWFDDDGNETPLSGAIVLSWWPKPELTELEKWDRDKRIRKKEREVEQGV